MASWLRLLIVAWLAIGSVLGLARENVAVDWIAAAELPYEAQQTLVLIKNDGPFPYSRDGIVFGAGTTDNLVDYGGQTVNAYALERLRAGARLARTTRLPVLLSGGVVWDGRPEAEMMKEVMDEFGVPVRWVESRSRDTADNARESAALLRAAGLSRVALVTHAFHMRRSMEEFRRAGLVPVAEPTLIKRPGDFC